MSGLQVSCGGHPQRTLALSTAQFTLLLKASPAPGDTGSKALDNGDIRCLVEFSRSSSVDMTSYRHLGHGYGTLGLITLSEDVFLCVVTGASKAATIRPGENIWRIESVDFFCLNHSGYEDGIYYESDSAFGVDELDRGENREVITDHPFLALKKLLSDGSFYYSLDFNLTDRLQNRSDEATTFDIDALDVDMLWNSYMISSLLSFRKQLAPADRMHLDSSGVLTCVIRGFCSTLPIPASTMSMSHTRSHFSPMLTIISRQSSRRAGTRFNTRGIDDDGNVANFVETETILWIPPHLTFSYVQIRGSVPVFWEQAPGFFPGQQKIEVIRSTEASEHAFNKHFEALELRYGAVHIVNLLSALKPGEVQLSKRFQELVCRSPLYQRSGLHTLSNHRLLQMTEFDFHAEARGPLGYGASNQIKEVILHSVDGFAFFLSENSASSNESNHESDGSSVVLQQEGVFRTNCLDCLDRTNLVQTVISLMVLESFLHQQGLRLHAELQFRHSTLWADNGDALAKMYAGTGALKSSFTRHGKMSLAGALADARKSATRLYVNNFSDKARQKTIDLLLGQLNNQASVHLFDPMNELISEELDRRAPEYTTVEQVKIWAGTFNVNGRHLDPDTDLSSWLFPAADEQKEDQAIQDPTIFAVGFQEIVSLSPQQIMSTDPTTRKVWEVAVRNCLNKHAARTGTSNYILLRSGQLVGAAIMIFVREDILKEVKNVEGSVKKTGLSGISGNKGGCAIRFEYSNTRICFVTAHFAAGFANYEERNRDYETIGRGLRFQRNKSIDDHDTIVWLGDFNYRIGLGNHEVRKLATQRNYQRLYENDQLNLQMMAGNVFQFYTEGAIVFPPTYKYDIGRDDFDSSEKARIPAWCDRILWKGSNLRQLHYSSAHLQFSDHRPVWAVFSCGIDVVDGDMRERLRDILCAGTQGDVPSMEVTGALNGSMIPSEKSTDRSSVWSGLPPASSDEQKWWLYNGAPVRSAVQPSPDKVTLNMRRESNPFRLTDPIDWVNENDTMDVEDHQDYTDVASQKPPLPPRGREIATSSRVCDQSISLGPRGQRTMPRKSTAPCSGMKTSSPVASRLRETLVSSFSGPITLPDVQDGDFKLPVRISSMTDGSPGNTQSSEMDKEESLPNASGESKGSANLLDDNVHEEIQWKPLRPQ
ncbi:SacI domain and endonuclease/exonuclease/phosphatase family protein [Aspergillus clavatus NRRL 1]|uniref:phosphoinositide 5-phosphatase n=1 Tax=Aspergillus clavatus (strain ATCC 1007 / CBS 513.65 / DSM 816 / NCTC 3887 / NRRL 1 / QM 1276 / 107) TaxID=344612 RepID=A1CD55_ASPCL|nr:SacI domain and endonuclease/exonuclease/phosphatase family protein [Aspergillus clavatus NRRL 1]EAW11782.1 SacI domain and endonuclease/exonuclease/phosphatase family protein [Aspergillus clavatus NRRL 1]